MNGLTMTLNLSTAHKHDPHSWIMTASASNHAPSGFSLTVCTVVPLPAADAYFILFYFILFFLNLFIS